MWVVVVGVVVRSSEAWLAKKADLEEDNGGERGGLGREEVKDKVADEITIGGRRWENLDWNLSR